MFKLRLRGDPPAETAVPAPEAVDEPPQDAAGAPAAEGEPEGEEQ